MDKIVFEKFRTNISSRGKPIHKTLKQCDMCNKVTYHKTNYKYPFFFYECVECPKK